MPSYGAGRTDVANAGLVVSMDTGMNALLRQFGADANSCQQGPGWGHGKNGVREWGQACTFHIS